MLITTILITFIYDHILNCFFFISCVYRMIIHMKYFSINFYVEEYIIIIRMYIGE